MTRSHLGLGMGTMQPLKEIALRQISKFPCCALWTSVGRVSTLVRVLVLAGLTPGAFLPHPPGSNPNALSQRSIFSEHPATPGSGSITLPGSIDSEYRHTRTHTHTHTHAHLPSTHKHTHTHTRTHPEHSQTVRTHHTLTHAHSPNTHTYTLTHTH